MPSAKRKCLPAESLLQLKRRLDSQPPRRGERKEQVTSMANLYGVSPATIYRALRELQKPKSTSRADYGRPRKMPASQREYIHWLLRNCSGGADPESMFTAEAIDLLASKFRTPLQVEQHLKLALEAGYQIETMDGYVKYLQKSPQEVEGLFRDLLFGVTVFCAIWRPSGTGRPQVLRRQVDRRRGSRLVAGMLHRRASPPTSLRRVWRDSSRPSPTAARTVSTKASAICWSFPSRI